MSIFESILRKSFRQTGWMLMSLICLLAMAVPFSLAHADEPVKIGVLAVRPVPQMQAQWQPLADALKKAIPEREFSVKALTYSELDMAVASRELDFVLTNPGHYVLLSQRDSLSAPLATLAQDVQGQAVSAFGGVIFSLADAASIRSLSDLKGKTIAIASTESLGSYQMQAYELKKTGIRLPQDVKLLSTGSSQDNVVNEVLAGRAEVGFVRTGLLEAMVHEGKLNMAQIKILNHESLAGFPMRVSTPLYPEWPFAALPHIDENLARRVAAELFTLEQNSTVTKAIGIHGFVIPADYTPVADILRELRMPPFDMAPEFTLQDVWNQYRWWVIVILIVGGLISFLVLRLVLINRKLDAERRIVLEQKQQLQESESRFRMMADNAPVLIWISGTDKLCYYFNKIWLEFTGRSMEQEIGNGWTEGVHPKDLQYCFNIYLAAFDARREFTMEYRLHRYDGEYRWVLDRGVPRFDNQGTFLGFIGSCVDISDRRETEALAHELAFYDPLTKLPNRRLLNERMVQIMSANKRNGHYAALMMLDMDNFKPLNDTHGHVVGDLLLLEVASRLRKCVREVDTVARFGGDEFVVMLGELDLDKTASAAQATAVAEKIRNTLASPYLLTVQHEQGADTTVEHHCTASIGVVMIDNHENSQDDLINCADLAMYQAKEAGRNQVRFYDANSQSSD